MGKLMDIGEMIAIFFLNNLLTNILRVFVN